MWPSSVSSTTHCILVCTDMDVNYNYQQLAGGGLHQEGSNASSAFLSLFSSQPLMDNLESQTYEVFEKDPIKYSQYQQVRIRGTAVRHFRALEHKKCIMSPVCIYSANFHTAATFRHVVLIFSAFFYWRNCVKRSNILFHLFKLYF